MSRTATILRELPCGVRQRCELFEDGLLNCLSAELRLGAGGNARYSVRVCTRVSTDYGTKLNFGVPVRNGS